MIELVICQPHKLIYCPVPKCASTTMFKLLGELGGAGPSPRPRAVLPILRGGASAGRGGSYVVRCDDRELADLARRRTGYVWFSVVRDPYTRVASNYHNKINRYAKRFDLCAYLCSYLGQALGGPAAWRSHGDRIRRMRAMISFDRFVRGLQRHGVAWDEHFRLQTQVLRVEDVSYHKIVRMEHLAAGLREVFACAGVGVAGETAIARLAWLNRSDTAKAPDLWTPAARAIVADIYRRDFETLGYPT